MRSSIWISPKGMAFYVYKGVYMNDSIFKDGIQFSELNISDELMHAITDLGYQSTTSIQTQAIPLLLEGKDVIGRSNTGTGKTAAFGIPAIHMMDPEMNKPQVLVLAPTRELAVQISIEMEKYAKNIKGIRIATLYGGVPMDRQIRQLKQANVIVGTPGRIQDHMRRRTLRLNTVQYVVLDEADEMLSMGFVEDINNILSKTPNSRQTTLFSATMPPSIVKISNEYLKDPVTVDVMNSVGKQASIDQLYYIVPGRNKKDALTLLLRKNNLKRTIIFSNTKSMVDDLAVNLREQNFKAAGLHGDLPQQVRSQVLNEFRSGNTNILIATDVAARGIDIDDVDCVINFDLPQSHEYYVHRIGRTGRAGKTGLSLTLVSGRQQIFRLKDLMRITKNNIIESKLPDVNDIVNSVIDNKFDELVADTTFDSNEYAASLIDALKSTMSFEEMAYRLAANILNAEMKTLDVQALDSVSRQSQKELPRRHSNKNMMRLSLQIGRRNKIKPSHIVGAITDQFDVGKDSIGKIVIKDNYTHVDFSQDLALEVLDAKKNVKINGNRVEFEPISSKPERASKGKKRTHKSSKRTHRNNKGKSN